MSLKQESSTSARTSLRQDSVVSAFSTSTPEARKRQVDQALEYALEQAIAQRPVKPLTLLAQRLRLWDDAVNGSWGLRKRCVQVFEEADADGSGVLDFSEMAKLAGSEAFAQTLVRSLDADKNGKVNLAEWLIYMKQNYDVSKEAAAALLDGFEEWLAKR